MRPIGLLQSECEFRVSFPPNEGWRAHSIDLEGCVGGPYGGNQAQNCGAYWHIFPRYFSAELQRPCSPCNTGRAFDLETDRSIPL